MLYCSNCKIQIQKKGQFCPKCGNPLGWKIDNTLKPTWKISWYVLGLSYLFFIITFRYLPQYIWYGIFPAYVLLPLFVFIILGIILVVQIRKSKQLTEIQIWKRAIYYTGISILILVQYSIVFPLIGITRLSPMQFYSSLAFCIGIGMLFYCLWRDKQLSRKQ